MSRRLPSVNGLRAFEAAARHGSFVGASAELNVTQAAVSRMVRRLEERLAFPVVRAAANGLALTPRARRSARPHAAFDAIAGITEQVAAMRSTPTLILGVGPSFAMRWLIPRLAALIAGTPEIEVRLATGGATNPVSKDDWTCWILLGTGDGPATQAEPMFSEKMLPVLSRSAIAQCLARPCGSRKH